MTLLFLGIGNPGRQDDGLGPALAEEVERWKLPEVTVDSDYQLTVEDASAVAEHDVLVIADAAVSGPEPYSFRKLEPSKHLEFSSHSVEPGGVLGIAEHIFGKRPQAYVLAIRGYEFAELVEGFTPKAQANLEAARTFIEPILRNRTWEQAASPRG